MIRNRRRGCKCRRASPCSRPKEWPSLRQTSDASNRHAERTGDAGQIAPLDADDAPNEPSLPDARSARHLWHSLPGICLALDATGCEIELETEGPMTGALILWSPESKGLLAGPNLDELEHIAEQQASYREQFLHAPIASPWHRNGDD
ncbi:MULTISPECIES: hypothetical protein [unclassified Variovorax]|uniref:hypothetical protein n=1 Tax=unclassified Variovorax TaxID=663243 RepID=UPI003F44931E